MHEHVEVAATEEEWSRERARSNGRMRIVTLVAFVTVPLACAVAAVLGDAVASGTARLAMITVFDLALLAPTSLAVVWISERHKASSDRVVHRLLGQLGDALRAADAEAARRERQAEKQRHEARLANALDLVDDEAGVVDVIERSFAAILPGSPVELLLADNSHAHLRRTAAASLTGDATGCGVESPDRCPAARRFQIQRFADSEAIDACPKLRDRPEGPLSALCVPVSIMGRTVGVIHTTAGPHAIVADETTQSLATLANLAGARIGLVRVMADTKLQAATDSLTGLLNRRTFEHEVTMLPADGVLSVAMGDLDHFKTLNDTYGHETGDRALRLFSQVLRDSVRSHDIVGRQGGEEFVVAFPACDADSARGVLDAVRARLEAAITVAGLPTFTVSFGVTQAAERRDLPRLLARADAALFEAKRAGRDQVVVHDALGQTVPVSSYRARPRLSLAPSDVHPET